MAAEAHVTLGDISSAPAIGVVLNTLLGSGTALEHTSVLRQEGCESAKGRVYHSLSHNTTSWQPAPARLVATAYDSTHPRIWLTVTLSCVATVCFRAADCLSLGAVDALNSSDTSSLMVSLVVGSGLIVG